MKTLILILAFGLLTAVAAETFVIVVHPENPATEISKADLNRLFTGKKSDLDGRKMVPVNQPLEGETATAFLKEIAKMSPAQYKEFWVAQQVKGLGSAPMIQKTSEAVIAIVSQVPGGIGYVDKDKVTGAVKVLAVK